MFNANTDQRPFQRFEFLPHVIIGALVVMVLIAAGQPITTDDLWWHLALGDAYARAGPWLEQDPLLFTSPGPPVAAAWLADLGLHWISNFGGFNALRLTHVFWVAGILTLAWCLFWRASRSRMAASLCKGAFLSLSAYRLIQLRPHLLTMLFTLLLYRILLESKDRPSRWQIVGAVLLCALWPNLHAGFLLGPALIMAEIAGFAVYGAVQGAAKRRGSSNGSSAAIDSRFVWLAGTLVLGTLATSLSPAGFDPHLAYVVAGTETPSLTRVADEWTPFAALAIPQPGGLIKPMTWVVYWLLVSGCLIAAIGPFIVRSNDQQSSRLRASPGLVALSLLGIVAPLIAVRFLWLGIFPLLLLSTPLGRLLGAPTDGDRGSNTERNLRPLFIVGSATAAATLLIVGFSKFGDWPAISRSIPRNAQQYAKPYFATKYQAHAVWMLRDAELEGNLFNEYYMGGFLGYWLAPNIRTFVNGTLNVKLDAMDANLPIRERRGALAGESFTELLDRQGVDLFLGIGLPRVKQNRRPWFHTTAHLENTPGWILVFRNLTSSVYMRDHSRNAENLSRVGRFYRDRGVPFDADRGFDTARVIREAESWSFANGVIPTYYDQLVKNSKDTNTETGFQPRNLLASFYGALGLYGEAIEMDHELLARFPDATPVRRRLIWCLLRIGSFAGAAELAQPHVRSRHSDPLLQRVEKVASDAIDAEARKDSAMLEKLSGRIARLPVFTIPEARALRTSVQSPALREALVGARSAGD
jgi:hypothetical protein